MENQKLAQEFTLMHRAIVEIILLDSRSKVGCYSVFGLFDIQ